MQRKFIILPILVSFVLCYGCILFSNENNSPGKISSATSPAEAEITSNLKFISLSLKDSIVYALRNNFDIEISKLNSNMKDYEITVQKAKYDPTLKLEGNIENDDVPINSKLVGGLEHALLALLFNRERRQMP